MSRRIKLNMLTKRLLTAKTTADFVRRWLDNRDPDSDGPGWDKSAQEEMLKELERLALGMPTKRLPTAKTITKFSQRGGRRRRSRLRTLESSRVYNQVVQWLNDDDPDWQGWDKSDCVAVLR
jgi:hypothetical protein